MYYFICSIVSIQAGDLVNPVPKTAFCQRMEDKKESQYLSKKRAPLGKILVYIWVSMGGGYQAGGCERCDTPAPHAW